MRSPVRSRQEGSIPLVLLAAIVLGGIIIALYIDVTTGLRLSAADRDFNQAIQVADAGLQNAFTTLAALEEDDRPAIGDELQAGGELDLELEGELGRGTFEWSAVRVGSNRWQVRSVGVFGVHTRVLEAEMSPLRLFGLAAFGDLLLEMRGANAADSYNDDDPNGVLGTVGSNNHVNLRGNAIVDWVWLYGGATYNEGGIIRPGGGIETDDYQDLPDLGLQAYADGGACHNEDRYDDISRIGTLVRGVTYCVSQAIFGPGEHPIVPNPNAALNDQPTRIYIAPSGNLELRGQGNQRCDEVACVNWTVGDDTPDATALEIYLAGGEGEVKANNHTVIAAGIYAPRSACSGPNAQGDVYGSIVCRTIDSRGGWDFHFDERFADVDLEYFAIRGVREEPGGTTSFAVGD
ncbi:MAG: hypothetical protein ACNA8R_04790 [Nitriliruptoraceae bacterium]